MDIGLFVSLEEAGLQLGISPQSVRRLVEEKKLIAYKFRRSLRIEAKSIAAYIAACKVEIH